MESPPVPTPKYILLQRYFCVFNSKQKLIPDPKFLCFFGLQGQQLRVISRYIFRSTNTETAFRMNEVPNGSNYVS